uniref:CLIC N-terminal domain-containing protein n=1 Tax=Capra hircus TaxID=9925 RepID=A0A8C2NT76_CAPHI
TLPSLQALGSSADPSSRGPSQGEDGESVGHCPSCQRLFMVLLLKGVPFTLTTVDTRRSPEVLKDFAPGSQLPILLCDGDAKTDTLQIEEFLEETLGPPEFPSLAPRYRESAAAGNDVFHTFSAFIKNPVPAQDDALHQQLLRALAKLDSYLRAPLEHEHLCPGEREGASEGPEALSFCHSQTPTVGRSTPDNSPQGQAGKPVGGVRPISLLLLGGGTGLGSQTSQARVGRQDGWGGWGAKPHMGNSGPEGGPHIPQLCPSAGRPPPTSLAILWGLHH